MSANGELALLLLAALTVGTFLEGIALAILWAGA